MAARLVLAAVFAVAGLAKLADREGSRWALEDFGLPARLAAPLAVALPVAELGVAVALVPAATAWWGAVGALALLLAFVAGISFNLARGHRPECNCFGQIRSSPAGPATLARNVALAALGGFVLWAGYDHAGPGPIGWLGGLGTVQAAVFGGSLALVLILGAQWFVTLNLLQQNGRLMVRLDRVEESLKVGPLETDREEGPRAGLAVGARAPDFVLQGLYGETHTLESLRASERPLLLLFTDPDCGPCTALLPEVGRWQREVDAVTIAPVSRGSPERNRAKAAEHGVSHVLLQRDMEVVDAYGVWRMPSAVLVADDGTIATPPASGAGGISALVENLAAGRSPCPDCGGFHEGSPHDGGPRGLPVGEPAPDARLRDLEGREVALSDFRGHETLLLFWSPTCTFCKRMLPDLRAHEDDPPPGGPEVVVVSSGSVESNEAMGLRSTVVLDDGFATGGAFGAAGTPSAILLDAEGRVASGVAAGATGVLRLARVGSGV